jgi:hypothetical protein
MGLWKTFNYRMKILKYEDYMRDNLPSEEDLDDYFLEYIDNKKCNKKYYFKFYNKFYNIEFHIKYEMNSSVSQSDLDILYKRLKNFGVDFKAPSSNDGYDGDFYIIYDGKNILNLLDSIFDKSNVKYLSRFAFNKKSSIIVWEDEKNQELVSYDASTKDYTILNKLKQAIRDRFTIIYLDELLSWYLSKKFDFIYK